VDLYLRVRLVCHVDGISERGIFRPQYCKFLAGVVAKHTTGNPVSGLLCIRRHCSNIDDNICNVHRKGIIEEDCCSSHCTMLIAAHIY
jgi:hypothetical protein